MYYEIGGGMMDPNDHWVLTDDYLLTSKLAIPCNEIDTISNLVEPGPLANGVITVWHKGESYDIAYAESDTNKVQEFINHVEELHRKRLAMAKPPEANAQGIVYSINGVRGRHIDVYEDKCVISVKAGLGSFITGNISDGEKTIYYRDCIGIQFKKSGFQIGYLQLETASGLMNNRNNNFFNENSFTFDFRSFPTRRWKQSPPM